MSGTARPPQNPNIVERDKILFIISGSSGVGKTTLCDMLLKQNLDLNYSISYTTRPRRPKEEDGDNYHFIATDTFEKMVDENRFVEWNQVHGYFYGTSLDELEQALADLGDVLMEVDVHGAVQVKEQFKHRCILIFITPPRVDGVNGVAELVARLERRGAETAEAIEHRLKRVEEESRMVAAYDYCVVNDDFDRALELIMCIIQAERCRTSRLTAVTGEGT